MPFFFGLQYMVRLFFLDFQPEVSMLSRSKSLFGELSLCLILLFCLNVIMYRMTSLTGLSSLLSDLAGIPCMSS